RARAVALAIGITRRIAVRAGDPVAAARALHVELDVAVRARVTTPGDQSRGRRCQEKWKRDYDCERGQIACQRHELLLELPCGRLALSPGVVEATITPFPEA